jgi:vanillate/3-O-methylgallate O-demethylase
MMIAHGTGDGAMSTSTQEELPMAWDAAPTLQQALDQAGSPMKLLWKPADPWLPPRIESEYEGWAAEQTAWHEGVAISDLSFHMYDTFLEGSDVVAFLSHVSANNYESFAVDQAKQLPVTERGFLIGDGILLREAENRFTLTGAPAAHGWLGYQAAKGGFDVQLVVDSDMSYRQDSPKLFRFQIQGPRSAELVESAFGGPIPESKFFHSVRVELDGRRVRALRHDMAGQSGWEFVGDFADHEYVKDKLMTAGAPLGLAHIGAIAYPTSAIESGWVASPTPAIYTDADLRDYRESLSLFSFEGQLPMYGSFYSDDIEDYYVTPYDLGYGRSISFNHDFVGKAALQAHKEAVRRTKMTLAFDPADVATVVPAGEIGLSFPKHRVEADGRFIGYTVHLANLAPYGTMLALALIDSAEAKPGTEVTVTWGHHPGDGTAADADLGYPKLRATLQPAPFSEVARTAYRAN